MLPGEASLHYGIDGHELLAMVSAGELCDLCYEQHGDCEHTGDMRSIMERDDPRDDELIVSILRKDHD